MSTPDHARSRERTAEPRGSHGARAAACVWACLAVVVLAPSPAGVARASLRPVASHRASGLDWTWARGVYDEVDRRARRLDREDRALVARAILEEATRADLAPALVLAVIHVESGFRPRAVSRAGAVGLMQLKPSTLWRVSPDAVDPLDPVANVRAGVRYLRRLLDAFEDLELALVAYNAGPKRLRRHLEAGPVPDRFLRYVRDVRRHADRYGPLPLASAAPLRAAALGTAHGAVATFEAGRPAVRGRGALAGGARARRAVDDRRVPVIDASSGAPLASGALAPPLEARTETPLGSLVAPGEAHAAEHGLQAGEREGWGPWAAAETNGAG